MLEGRAVSVAVLVMAVMLCVACSPQTPYADRSSEGAGGGDEATAGEAAGDREARPSVEVREGGLVVHEWGTFTSVQGSDGAVLEGMHHEEEGLPPFVYGRAFGMAPKGVEFLPEGVTQKLETPVLYFYTGAPMAVDVKVGFPQGLISQWYPAAAAFLPGVDEAQGVQDGWMDWRVELSPETLDVPWVPEDDVWAPSRRVDAASVSVGDEHERFIFYRGLGRFEVPFRVTSVEETLTLHNGSDQAIPDAFLLHVNDEGGCVMALGGLEAHGQLVAELPSPKERQPLDAYVAEASDRLAAALVASGLYEDEAIAMVDTWSRSYFRTPGLRVLYVVPRAWTDALLPIELEPEPDALVRTMVGRVEVLTEREERALVRQFETMADDASGAREAAFGRFLEPKLRRIAELVSDPALKAQAEAMAWEAAEAF